MTSNYRYNKVVNNARTSLGRSLRSRQLPKRLCVFKELIMELKEFVRQTIEQIVEGVAQA